MFLKRPLFIAIAINLFFLALCLVFGDLKFGAIDDYFMAAVLTGAHGLDYDPRMVFVNAIYGYALLPLYHLFPTVGWYYIGEMFSVFLSFTTISYILLKKLGTCWGAFFATLFVAFFASDFYLVLQFTQCASILSGAGMLAFAFAVSEAGKEPRGNGFAVVKGCSAIGFGVFLLLWGSLMRWQAFLMGMPFFCLGMLFLIKKCWAVKWRVLVGMAVMFVAAFAMHNWDQKLYQAPEYKAFMDIQGPRVMFGDGGNYNENAVYEDFEEMGKSGQDFHMLTEWIFYDTEAFSADSLKAMGAPVVHYRDPVVEASLPDALLRSLGHSVESPLFWIWFIFCVVLIFTKRGASLYPWATLLLVLGLMSHLLEVGRLVYRVESGFWLYASVLAVPLIGRIRFEPPKKMLWVVLAAIGLANIYIYATSGTMVRGPSSGEKRTLVVEDSTNYNQIFDFIDSEPDKLFLLSMKFYMRFSHHRMPPYKAEPIGSYRRIISFGYWTPYLPEVTQALKDYGVTNPMKDVVHDNVIVVGVPYLDKFLQRHYYDSVAVDSLKRIGEMNFYKYRLVKRDSVGEEDHD